MYLLNLGTLQVLPHFFQVVFWPASVSDLHRRSWEKMGEVLEAKRTKNEELTEDTRNRRQNIIGTVVAV